MDVKADLANVCAGGFGVTLLFLAPVSRPGAGSTAVPLPARERGADGSARGCVTWGSGSCKGRAVPCACKPRGCVNPDRNETGGAEKVLAPEPVEK